MLDALLRREVVIGLAIAGAVLVMLASALAARLGPQRSAWLNRAGYAITTVSVVIFIVIGFRGPAQ